MQQTTPCSHAAVSARKKNRILLPSERIEIWHSDSGQCRGTRESRLRLIESERQRRPNTESCERRFI
eukprot:66495-Rhodomonas_salina.1